MEAKLVTQYRLILNGGSADYIMYIIIYIWKIEVELITHTHTVYSNDILCLRGCLVPSVLLRVK